ncbi:MAG: hypothetical protein K8S27_07470 [Candidatus Omnitrophica bacterium]|nr:hypothetical protein [Candidatus Omnitrophota bacterium]
MTIGEYLKPYMNIGIGVGLYFVFWGLFAVSMKVSIRKTVGKATYRRIMKEYKDLVFDRWVGICLAVIGMVSCWAVLEFSATLLSWDILTDNELIYAIPFIFYFSSIYCQISALIKAMSNLM